MTLTEIAALVGISELNDCIQQLDGLLGDELLEPVSYSSAYEPIYTAIDFLRHDMPSGSVVVMEFRDTCLAALPEAVQPADDIAQLLGAVDAVFEEMKLELEEMEFIAMRFKSNSEAAMNAGLDRLHQFEEIEFDGWIAHNDIETTHEVLAEATKSVDRLIAVMTAAIASGERVLTAFDQYYPDYVMNDD